jgi:hypothetical protein
MADKKDRRAAQATGTPKLARLTRSMTTLQHIDEHTATETDEASAPPVNTNQPTVTEQPQTTDSTANDTTTMSDTAMGAIGGQIENEHAPTDSDNTTRQRKTNTTETPNWDDIYRLPPPGNSDLSSPRRVPDVNHDQTTPVNSDFSSPRRVPENNHDQTTVHSDLSPPRHTPDPTVSQQTETSDGINQLVKALNRLVRPSQVPFKGAHFQIPTFDGSQDRYFETFETELEEYCRCMGWDDNTRVRSLAMILKGRARQLYTDFPPEVKSDWSAAMTKLRSLFGRKATSKMLNFSRLERMQTKNETVRDYSIDMVQRLSNAGITDSEQRLLTYYRGLLPHIKRAVLLLQPATLEECERDAMLVESNFRHNGTESHNDQDILAIHEQQNTNNKPQANHSNRPHAPTQTHNAPIHRTNEQPQRDAPHTRPWYNDSNRHNRQTYQPRQTGQYNNTPRGQTYQPRQTGPYNNTPRGNYYRPRQAGQYSEPQQRDNYQPNGFPYCVRCQCRHEYSRHVNPICGLCGQAGHMRRDCKNF